MSSRNNLSAKSLKRGGRASAAYQRSRTARGNFFFGAARVGSAGPDRSTPQRKPLSGIQRIRCAHAAPGNFLAARARIESRSDRACVKAAGCGDGSSGRCARAGPTFSTLAHAPGSFAGAGGARDGRFCGISQRPRTRPDAFFHRYVAARSHASTALTFFHFLKPPKKIRDWCARRNAKFWKPRRACAWNCWPGATPPWSRICFVCDRAAAAANLTRTKARNFCMCFAVISKSG